MRSTFTKVRALVLVVVLTLTIVPTASAAMRNGDGDLPRFDRERIVRIVKQVLKKFGVSTNSDQVSPPKP